MEMPKTRQECYKMFRNTVSPAFFCDATWDSMLCWPPTMPGMTIRKPCPGLPGFDVSKYAYKTCQKDGQWYRVPASTREWTNYSNCMVESFTAKPNLASSREQVLPLVSNIDIIAFVCYSISILALLASIILFACNTSKKTRRHQVLLPLLFSAMALCLVSIVDLSIREVDKRNNRSLRRNINVCQAISFITRFFQIATSSWILMLSINYLIPAMKYHFRSGRLLLMYLLGYGIPLVFTPAWLATARHVLTNKRFCFSQQSHLTHWIADAPMLTCIAISLCLFIVCVVVVCEQKPSHNNNFNRQQSEGLFLKQGSIRGLILVLYVAVVEVYLAVSLHVVTGVAEKTHAYIEVAVKSTFGMVIAVFLGFLDMEICCCGKEPPDSLVVGGSYRVYSRKY